MSVEQVHSPLVFHITLTGDHDMLSILLSPKAISREM